MAREQVDSSGALLTDRTIFQTSGFQSSFCQVKLSIGANADLVEVLKTARFVVCFLRQCRQAQSVCIKCKLQGSKGHKIESCKIEFKKGLFHHTPDWVQFLLLETQEKKTIQNTVGVQGCFFPKCFFWCNIILIIGSCTITLKVRAQITKQKINKSHP